MAERGGAADPLQRLRIGDDAAMLGGARPYVQDAEQIRDGVLEEFHPLASRGCGPRLFRRLGAEQQDEFRHSGLEEHPSGLGSGGRQGQAVLEGLVRIHRSLSEVTSRGLAADDGAGRGASCLEP